MYRHSLGKRVAIAFALCITVLSLAWGFAFFAAIKLTEDQVLQRQLQLAAKSYPAMPQNLRGYPNMASLPAPLQQWAQTHPTAGVYEFEAEELHVAVLPANGEQPGAFVVYDVAGVEAASAEDWWWLLIIIGMVGTLGVIGFGLGVLMMRRAVAPVLHLAKVVADINLARPSTEDYTRIGSGRFGNDEVGILAATIEQTLERVSAFIARERDFTDSASHELRTPITVITGALELLEQSELSATDIKALDRIKRATLEMKTTIEMFLCLAREDNKNPDNESFSVLPLVNKAIEQQRYLLRHKLVEVNVEQLTNPEVCGHPQAFAIAVNNLVRNAFEHTLDAQTPIIISIKAKELLVTNQLSINADEQHILATSAPHGYGLGLGIVQRLCERNGWQFSLQVNAARVIARLSW